MSIPHIVLLGPMAAGKTSLGRALARRLETEFVDSDQVIFDLTGSSAAEIEADRGVPELHRIEKEMLWAALSRSPRSVIAAAASVVDDEATRKEMSRHLCVWVEADLATLARRRGSEAHRRSITEDQAEDLNRARRRNALELTIGQVDTSAFTMEQSAACAVTILSDHLDRKDN